MSKSRLNRSLRLVISHYWAQVRQDRLNASLGMVLPGIGNILVFYIPTLVVARLLGRFNESAAEVSFGDTLPYILAFMGIWALGEATWRFAVVFLIRFEVRSMERLHKQAMSYLMQKDQGFFNDNFAGSLTKKSLAFAKSFENVSDTISFSVISNILPMFFIGFVLWRFSPWLVLVLFGMMTLTLAMMFPLLKRRQKLVQQREAASNKLSGYIADAISNISVIHTFARESSETKLHGKYVEDYMHKTKRAWDYQNLRIDTLTSPMYVMTNTVGLVLAIALGKNNSASFEAIFVTFSYFSNFTRVLWEFNRIYRNLESSFTEAAQFTELLLDEPKIQDIAQPEPSRIHSGGITFKNVTFQYEDNRDAEPLLENFDLSIKPGEKIGLVGHSGGGKTTVSRLLLRFMDIQNGTIAIDGQDISSLKQSDLRSHIAYVSQDPMLFHRSLADNIRYGNPSASQAEVEAIAKYAHAHDFVIRLKDGYDTLVGERGVKLSGGQRQRVAIARAMIKNAPILVLDEATSALDSESEQLIQDALWKLMEGRTAIVIAHRLSTIQKMDRIIVMEEGRIVEQGSHKELLLQKGIYASLWARQSGGFIDE